MLSKSPAEEVALLLGKCALFRDLDHADRLALATRSTRRNYAPGDAVFITGDPGESLMGILQGHVRISRPTVDGGQLIIADFGPGEVFGEIAILDGQGRSADATALTNCEMVVVERRELIALLERRPAFALSLLSLVAGKLRQADQRSSDFLFLDLSARLAKALLARAGDGKALPAAGAKLSLTQGELALIVGGTRPNVNRLLKEWQRSGLIDQRKGWIVIVQPAQLAALGVAERKSKAQ
jgi:CRP-like cAMP-binding protein